MTNLNKGFELKQEKIGNDLMGTGAKLRIIKTITGKYVVKADVPAGIDNYPIIYGSFWTLESCEAIWDESIEDLKKLCGVKEELCF